LLVSRREPLASTRRRTGGSAPSRSSLGTQPSGLAVRRSHQRGFRPVDEDVDDPVVGAEWLAVDYFEVLPVAFQYFRDVLKGVRALCQKDGQYEDFPAWRCSGEFL